MENTFFADIESLSPTHHFLCENKLSEAEKHFKTHSLEDYPPLSVIKFGGKLLLIDGHHLAYYISTQGKHIARVCEKSADANLFLSLKLESQCRKKNILSLKDLSRKILNLEDYNAKWVEKYELEKEKMDQNPLLGLKLKEIENGEEKIKTANSIFSPIPEYFTNEFIYRKHIEKTRDMRFLSFNVNGYPIAFAAVRAVYEKVLEIFILGIHEKADTPELDDRIIKEIIKIKKSLKKEYLTVKIPAKSAVENSARKLHDFYLKYGFSKLESIISPWDEKRLCVLLINH